MFPNKKYVGEWEGTRRNARIIMTELLFADDENAGRNRWDGGAHNHNHHSSSQRKASALNLRPPPLPQFKFSRMRGPCFSFLLVLPQFLPLERIDRIKTYTYIYHFGGEPFDQSQRYCVIIITTLPTVGNYFRKYYRDRSLAKSNRPAYWYSHETPGLWLVYRLFR